MCGNGYHCSMKQFTLILLVCFICSASGAADRDSIYYYNLPDSVKASQFLAEINIQDYPSRREAFAGISARFVRLSLEADKKEKEIVFEFPSTAVVVAAGINTDAHEKGEISWAFEWSTGETYQLLIAAASDSAENFSLFSGYIFLPKEKKWKLIGTCRIEGQHELIQEPARFFTAGKNQPITPNFGSAWCQRGNGSWKNLDADNKPVPAINLFGHTDSSAQRQLETRAIEAALNRGAIDTRESKDGVYYHILQEGGGNPVSVNDTVTVNYKLTLFSDGSFVDGTKDKPASFPLKRLIRGWQIGVPLCKTGGKIRLIIPSDLGYSIRTRAAKIPPNSILVFEIEVLEARPPR